MWAWLLTRVRILAAMTRRPARKRQDWLFALFATIVAALLIVLAQPRGTPPARKANESPTGVIAAAATDAAARTPLTEATPPITEAPPAVGAPEVVVTLVDGSGRLLHDGEVALADPQTAPQRTTNARARFSAGPTGLVRWPAAGRSFPELGIASAPGYQPRAFEIAGPGAYRVELTPGCRIEVEIVMRDGAPRAGLPCVLSTAMTPTLAELLGMLAGDPVSPDPQTALHWRTTDHAGRAVFDNLAPGPVFCRVPVVGTFHRSNEPQAPSVPDHQQLRLVVDDLYAVALRTPGDRVVGEGANSSASYAMDQTKVVVVFGDFYPLALSVGHERVGGGLCIPFVKRADVPEQEFLQWKQKGTAVLERRGLQKFEAHPIRWADLENAPVWDFGDVLPRTDEGHIVLTPSEAEQAPTLRLFDRAAVVLTGTSASNRGTPYYLTPGFRQAVLPGTYDCKPVLGYEARIEVAPTVTITSGGETALPFRLKEMLVPVRFRAVDALGIEHKGCFYRFNHKTRAEVSAGGVPTSGISYSLLWLPPGPYDVWIQLPSATAAAEATETFEIPAGWSEKPIELSMTVR